MNKGRRIQNLRQQFGGRNIDAILVSQPENRYYLSGFSGSAGYLLITEQNALLATDFRYVEQAKGQSPDYEVVRVTGELTKWLPEVVSGFRLKRLGFEAEHTAFAIYQKLTDIIEEMEFQFGLVPVAGLVESLREVKEPEEIELISRAAGMADAVMDRVEDVVQPGMTELAAAWEIESCLRQNGSDHLPFNIIVASGPNAALPHAVPSSRVINPGEPVVIDIGARVDGYTSDLSRTICLGTPDDNFSRAYRAVLAAQGRALELIRAEMTGSEADGLARAVLAEAGYGDAFGHSLGHGVGLATHEKPHLGPGSADRLADGMVFTVEPGIYLAGWGGVRIEDMAVMENGKLRVISRSRK
ncbi:MAG: aminopeptidase P family protein [Chloroflexota bacterium]